MPTIRQLIEHLDVIGDYRPVALEAEQFGDDLMQAWISIENGAHLLWLASAVGVEPTQIITVACDLLAEVFEQIETAGQETAQVLEAVHAWQKGEQSADEVDRSGWDAYSLIAHMDPNKELPPDAHEVADAAVWLTYLVRDLFPSIPADLAELDHARWCENAWMMVNCLAQALADHQNPDDTPPSERQRAFEKAMGRFAILIREHISGIEVQTTAQQRGVCCLSQKTSFFRLIFFPARSTNEPGEPAQDQERKKALTHNFSKHVCIRANRENTFLSRNVSKSDA